MKEKEKKRCNYLTFVVDKMVLLFNLKNNVYWYHSLYMGNWECVPCKLVDGGREKWAENTVPKKKVVVVDGRNLRHHHRFTAI